MLESLLPRSVVLDGASAMRAGGTPIGRREPKVRDTRERVLRAGLEEFAERGYQATSIADIASRAGVTTGAVYYYFADKEDLAADLQADLWTRLGHDAKARFDPDAPALDSLKRTFHTFLGVLDDHAEAAFFLRAPDGCQQEQETGIRFVRTLLERGIARGELAPVAPDAAARVVVGTFTEAMLHILDTKQFDQTVDVVERMIDALAAPAASRPA